MSSLNVIDLVREDRKHIRIGLHIPKRNRFFFFGGGGGFWILTFQGRVPKKHPKNVSWEKSICKSSLISWVISVQ